jgi:hypothetical protein
MHKVPLMVCTALLLSACDLSMLGLGPDPRVAQKEAEARATGGACRYGMRGIEDCYTLNRGVNKSAIFEGWREMDVYMRENKIEGVRAVIPLPPEPPPSAPVSVSAPPANDAADEVIEETVPRGKAKKAAAH